ncbi:MAG: shikimate dehydrogenase [Blastocatellia bacterium]
MDQFVCVSITESLEKDFISALREADGMRKADGVVDGIELRLDYLEASELPRLLDWLAGNGDELKSKLVLTFRPREQGGRRDITLAERQKFWRTLDPSIKARATLVDFEWDLVESLRAEEPPVAWEKVVCSWHDFGGMPADLIERYERMAATPAAVVKIAALANRIEESLEIFNLLKWARGRKPLIALAMGLEGLTTRVLGLSRGGQLTFAALRSGAESAAGQPTVTELRELYRVGSLTEASQVFGVIGNPVGHSRSPRIHNSILATLGIDGVYLPLPVRDLDVFIRDFVRPSTRRIDWNLRGLSVTIPHKLSIIPHLDHLDETARRIGAVNTVVVEGGELHGYNTDVTGAMKPLEALIPLCEARVAVIGAGGSARAICYGLQLRGAKATLFVRDVAKAQNLAAEFGAEVSSLENFKPGGGFDVVINCTPLGMHGHSQGQSPLPPESLTGTGLVYDLVYTPERTRLLEDAIDRGCRTLGGLAMLVNQAAEQFRLWTGLDAPGEVMWNAARQWTKVTGTILAGHQVASKPSNHYPQGTIEMQAPFFRARGLDLDGLFRGTLNISIAPKRFELRHATHFFPQVEWTTRHPPENFSFCRCRLTVSGRTVNGWVYYPHPETKIRHHQESSILEVIAPWIDGLSYGANVTLELLPDEIAIE